MEFNDCNSRSDRAGAEPMRFVFDIELDVLPNRVVLRDISRNKALTHKAAQPFSSEQHLIADQAAFEAALNIAMRELHSGLARLFSYPTVVLTSVAQPLEPVEWAALHAAISNIGGRKVIDRTSRGTGA